jgi:RNA polymerase sigma factor (sigma-70 family)
MPTTTEIESLLHDAEPIVLGVIVKHFAPAMRAHMDDMLSAGMEAVWHAAQKYDPGGGRSFLSFAYTRVRWAVIDCLRTLTRYRAKKALPVCSLDSLLDDGGFQELLDDRGEAPDSELLLEEELELLRRRVGKDWVLVQAFLEGRSLQGPARQLGLSESGARFRREALFAAIRAGEYGNLVGA